MASGTIISAPYEDDHWDKNRPGEMALFIKVRFETLIHPEEEGVLPRFALTGGHLDSVNWDPQASGTSINPAAADELEKLWRSFLEEKGQSPIVIADEVTTSIRFHEGAIRRIAVNAYERDSRAREACIRHYGTKCSACDFDFAERYGRLGKGYIHVHHVVPLSEVGENYEIDPVGDLRPVCPNCHAMLHREGEVLKVEQLRRIVQSHKSI